MSAEWPNVPLREVLTERQETPPDYALISGEISVIAKIGFNDGKIQLRNDGKTKTKMILVRPGDLVISGINAAKGAVSFYGEENADPIAATIHYSSYIPDKTKIDIKYLWWLLRSNKFRDLLLEYVPGGIKTEIKAKRFLPVPIPLPPLDEQRRTVARIEELAARIEEAQDLRRRAAEEAEMLLNSKLSSIFKRFVQQNGLSKLGDLIVKAGYGTSTKCQYETVENSVPVLRIPNIASEKIDFSDMKYGVLGDKELKKVLVSEDDLLVVRTNGSADLVGRCAVVSELLGPTAFASYLIRIRCDPEVIYPYYLQLMLKHLRTEGKLFNFARTTAGQYNVSLGRLREAEIPVPPLDEQRRIVARLDELQAQVDRLKKHQVRTAEELDALLPAVLDRAFRGQL